MISIVVAVALQTAAVNQVTIEQVQSDPQLFLGKKIKLCGEVAPDRSTLYSDTYQRIHGRVGVKLLGATSRGRGKCLIGRLTRADGQQPKAGDSIVVSDSALPDEYVFVVEERPRS
ncbi:hypothetical protein [Sphingomonas sp. ATCC 31555]|uniref:hypothetical protein n=1 Tax=Sphingomonas sp. ATCC 31555 TaxID=194867 RepID=UPI000A967585|nr:hypothetical protein [Sphingomonas sp. ATCC 31555]